MATIAGRPQSKGTWQRSLRDTRLWLLLLTAVLMLADGYLIFMVAPTDAVLGHVQRIFYVHVPTALVSYLGFLVCGAASIGFLIRRTERWDRLAYSSAEIGVVFVSLALVTGMIWARPVWNAWWQWEPRLTTTLILWFIYVAYLMIRQYAPTPQQGRVWSAVLGIIGSISVFLNYLSVELWRSIHPDPVIGPAAADGALEPTIEYILYFSMLTMLTLFVYLLLERVALRGMEDWLAQLRREGSRH